jgi:hypothetical protein
MNDIETVKKELQAEFKKYEEDKLQFKDYFTSMKEMSEWLKGKQKS